MNYILFDPPVTWENLLPLSFTRPVCEIRPGILTIRQQWEKRLNCRTSTITRIYLAKKYPVQDREDNLLINGSLFPDDNILRAVSALSGGQALVAGEKLLAVRLSGDDLAKFDPEAAGKYEEVNYGEKYTDIQFPWDIFGRSATAIEADFDFLVRGRKSAELPPDNILLGAGQVFMEEGASVHCATLNTSAGPIYISKDAEIMEGCHIRGPFVLGEKSTLKMGTRIYGPTSIGPNCKVGGEVNNSVFLGYSNKAHDGFLGNSVIGLWCNIGADSNNSNLKNNYSSVRIWNYREETFIPTGLIFCGLIMGDHSKCGINTMFNTGTVVGVNANIFGSGFPRNFIPSFSWGGPQGFSTYRIDKAIEVAREVMKRRGIKLDETDAEILTEVFGMTEKYRS